VRGKAGKEVEFGNTLFVAETQDGFICDYQLYQERAPGDTKELVASLERIESFQFGQSIKEVSATGALTVKTSACSTKKTSATTSAVTATHPTASASGVAQPSTPQISKHYCHGSTGPSQRSKAKASLALTLTEVCRRWRSNIKRSTLNAESLKSKRRSIRSVFFCV